MSLGIVCLARDCGRALWDLLTDLRPALGPGDWLVIVDDGADPAAAAWSGRFLAMEGVGPGIAVRRIVTGTRGAGDASIAANLGLAAMAAGDAPSHLLVLPGTARIEEEGLAAARAAAAAGADLVVAPTGRAGPPGTPDRALPGLPDETPAPGAVPCLGRTLFARGLLPPARDEPPCREGGAGWGELRLLHRLAARAQRPAGSAIPLGRLPWQADPGHGLAEAAEALLDEAPEAAPWLDRHLAALLEGLAPGAAAAHLPDLSRLAGRLPGESALAAALQAGGGRARTALRACGGDMPAPARTGRAPLRVACLGRHVHRMPLAYPAFAARWEGQVERVDDPATADLLLWAHPADPLSLTAGEARAAEGRTLALLSEEPFWDTMFSPDPLAPAITLRAARLGGIRLHQVNHHRSPIFDFRHLPYIPLTEPAWAARYAAAFARNARLTPEEWRAAFASRPLQAVFMAERRTEAFHDVSFPEGAILGLCAWRTRVAEACTGSGIARLGASWEGGPTRFDLADWHADKLARLDGQARVISAIENTYQPGYVSEKIFDAWACGALPAYMAGPGHRLHDLGLPEAARIELRGLDEAAAARRIAETDPAEVAEAYAAAQARLAALWSDEAAIAAERARIARAVVAELERLAEAGPA